MSHLIIYLSVFIIGLYVEISRKWNCIWRIVLEHNTITSCANTMESKFLIYHSGYYKRMFLSPLVPWTIMIAIIIPDWDNIRLSADKMRWNTLPSVAEASYNSIRSIYIAMAPSGYLLLGSLLSQIHALQHPFIQGWRVGPWTQATDHCCRSFIFKKRSLPFFVSASWRDS